MFTKRTVAAFAGVGLALSLSACSSESTEEANAAYCSASAETQSEVAALGALVAGDATVDQVQEQKEAIADAVEKSSEAAQDLGDSVKDDISAADDAFNDAVDAIPGDSTVSEAAGAYQAAVQAWDAAVLSIRTEVGCS